MSTTPTITVQLLNSQWDWPIGFPVFISDIYAVAQIIQQKLKLLMGEWWENTSLGLPLFQSILGQFTSTAVISQLIQNQILSTPYVTGIQNASISINPSTLEVSSSFGILTTFGPFTITGVNQTFTAVIN